LKFIAASAGVRLSAGRRERGKLAAFISRTPRFNPFLEPPRNFLGDSSLFLEPPRNFLGRLSTPVRDFKKKAWNVRKITRDSELFSRKVKLFSRSVEKKAWGSE
jgi:hypothetical protein